MLNIHHSIPNQTHLEIQSKSRQIPQTNSKFTPFLPPKKLHPKKMKIEHDAHFYTLIQII